MAPPRSVTHQEVLEPVTPPLEVSPTALVADPEAVLAGVGKIQGRSLGQIAWMRLKRDRVALGGAVVIVFLITTAILAPWIVKLLGDPPNEFHQDLIDTAGGTLTPIGPGAG